VEADGGGGRGRGVRIRDSTRKTSVVLSRRSSMIGRKVRDILQDFRLWINSLKL
jgi:hypothetical protein